jgi:Protein of unknown function (DUF5131)
MRYGSGRGPLHMWFGVSVEDGSRASRIRHLREAPAGMRFLSIEPLIGPVGTLDLTDLDWVIVGGESGPGARPMQAEWVRDIRDQCTAAGVAFFFKQWAGLRPKSRGRELDGREWNDFPRCPRLMPLSPNDQKNQRNMRSAWAKPTISGVLYTGLEKPRKLVAWHNLCRYL